MGIDVKSGIRPSVNLLRRPSTSPHPDSPSSQSPPTTSILRELHPKILESIFVTLSLPDQICFAQSCKYTPHPLSIILREIREDSFGDTATGETFRSWVSNALEELEYTYFADSEILLGLLQRLLKSPSTL